MKYFLSVLGVVLCVVLLCFVSEEGGVFWMVSMADSFTLCVMLLLIITILISAGLHRDFMHGFRLAISKKGEIRLSELKRAKEAMDLALKAIAGAGVLSFSISAVQSFLKEPQSLMPNLAVSMLGVVYAVFLFMLLIPIQAKLKIKIMAYMEE